MKKFNSILAIAAVALTSVLGFTSCDKNDDMLNQPGTTIVQPTDPKGDDGGIKAPATNNSTYNYVLFANDEVLNLGDVKVTVEQNGQVQEHKLSDAQTITKTFKKTEDGKKVDVSLSGKMLVITVKSGAKVTPAFDGNADAIAALQQDGKSNIIVCTACSENLDKAVNAISNAFVMNGLKNVKVVDYINARTTACHKTIE